MEEDVMIFRTKLMRSFIAKILQNLIKKNTNREASITINSLEAEHNGDRVFVHMDVAASMDSTEFAALIEQLKP